MQKNSKPSETKMDHQILGKWLGVKLESWPPDHYALLGLTGGEVDSNKIETAAQDKISRLRCYQISNPELATIAMNRLAEAYAFLTDPVAKAEYDDHLGIVAPPKKKTTTGTRGESSSSEDTVNEGVPAVVNYREAPPPPVRQNTAPDTQVIHLQEPLPTESEESSTDKPENVRADSPSAPASSSSTSTSSHGPFYQAAFRSRSARQGIHNRKAIYERILAYNIPILQRSAAAGVDQIEYWGDVAMQDRMIVPPDQWRRLDKQVWKRMIDATHAINPVLFQS